MYVQPTKRYSVRSADPIELFVPGRVCLFGEHSDWCCQFPAVGNGAALVSATTMGIFARCRIVADGKRKVYYRSHLGDAFGKELDMDEESLRLSAGDPSNKLGYVEGTVSRFLNNYPCASFRSSVEIDNYKTTLPLKKGLSSSAAICVLTVRALSLLLLGRQLPVTEEMNIAYEGERLTPSLCGRLDQVCAMLSPGLVASLAFEPNERGEVDIVVREVFSSYQPVHILIVNLAGSKDTIKILSSLQSAAKQGEFEIRSLFGPWNRDIVNEAAQCMKCGGSDPNELGQLALRAQDLFDKHAQPACPSELRAPALHKLLEDRFVRELASGGKSIGAGGDGTALLFTPSASSQHHLLNYLQGELGLEAWATVL